MDTPMNEEKLNNSSKASASTGNTGEAPKTDAARPEPPRRKKNIIRVYHAQNASDGGKSRKRPTGEKRPRPAGAAARPGQPARPAGSRPAGARPADPQGMRPAAERTAPSPVQTPLQPESTAAAGTVRPAAAVEKEPVRTAAPAASVQSAASGTSAEKDKGKRGPDT